MNEAYSRLMAQEEVVRETPSVQKNRQAERSHDVIDTFCPLAYGSTAHVSTAAASRVDPSSNPIPRWNRMCKNVLDTMWDSFRGPHITIRAGSKRATTFYLEIFKPMLEVYRERLKNDTYKCPQDFYKDFNFLLGMNKDRSTQKDIAEFARRVFEKKFARIVSNEATQ